MKKISSLAIVVVVGATIQMRRLHQTQIAASQAVDRARLLEALKIVRAPVPGK